MSDDSKDIKGGRDLEVSDELWNTFTDAQKFKHIHDNLVKLCKMVTTSSPCVEGTYIETRVTKLEKSKKWKNLYALLGGIIGGYGSKHLP